MIRLILATLVINGTFSLQEAEYMADKLQGELPNDVYATIQLLNKLQREFKENFREQETWLK
jgi:hypothetical protein